MKWTKPTWWLALRAGLGWPSLRLAWSMWRLERMERKVLGKAIR